MSSSDFIYVFRFGTLPHRSLRQSCLHDLVAMLESQLHALAESAHRRGLLIEIPVVHPIAAHIPALGADHRLDAAVLVEAGVDRPGMAALRLGLGMRHSQQIPASI